VTSKQLDYEATILFHNQLLENVNNRVMNLQLLFITEEAWFYLGGHFNKKKYI
jgi:hypothetical protein